MVDNPLEVVRGAGEIIKLAGEALKLTKAIRGWIGTSGSPAAEVGRAREEMMHLEERVVELREHALALRTELLAAREELSKRAATEELQSRVEYVRDSRFCVRVRAPRPTEPSDDCCSTCWEVERRLISLDYENCCPRRARHGPAS